MKKARFSLARNWSNAVFKLPNSSIVHLNVQRSMELVSTFVNLVCFKLLHMYIVFRSCHQSFMLKRPRPC